MAGKKWLTLGEASELLGVHPATLRAWADEGKIPSFRTPGGHRRFAREDLQAFMRDRSAGAGSMPQRRGEVVERAVATARTRLPQARSGAPWYEAFDEELRQRKRQEGRLLFALALQYVAKPEERPEILGRALDLARRYGEDSVRFGVSLVDTLRAIMFFRQALLDALEANGDATRGITPASFRVTQEVEDFIREVTYTVVDSYENALRVHLRAVLTAKSSSPTPTVTIHHLAGALEA